MEEKKGIRVSFSTFFLLLAIIAICIMAFFIYKISDDKRKCDEKVVDLQKQVESLNNTITNIQQNNDSTANNVNTKTTISNNTSVEETKLNKEELVKNLFTNSVLNAFNAKSRIDKINIITLENAKELYPNATSNAIFATVTYSVNDVNQIAGNGEVEGDWVINKKSCVYIDKENGEYKLLSSGTGW